jgi:DNA-binding NtrC family response regulator
MKVLLVDDEQKFITMLAKRLTLRGIQSDFAFSGEEALKKSETTDYDISVLDVKMPGISGTQLKKRLQDKNPEMKFIFVTGHGALDKPCEESNEVDIYLSKPLDIEALIKTIKQVVNKA